MKIHSSILATALVWLWTASIAVQAAEVTVKVGDPAPKLQIGKWVQGEPVASFANGTAYMVEFWATWCGPCIASIPHLNELHLKYKDKGLVVIGQNVWESDESKVAPFLKSMGKKMTYRVALDNKEGSERGRMADTWMTAAGQNGIPAAFLVNKEGKIAWIGHPMTLKESTIEAVLDGSFDLAKAAAAYEVRRQNEEKMDALWKDLQTAQRAKDWSKAEAALNEAEKLLPEDERDRLAFTRFTLLMGKGDYAAADKLAAKVSESDLNNSMTQNELAWQILTMKGVEKRNLKLAETIAERANTAAKGEDPNILDTLARAQFMLGKKNEAIATQQQAVDQSEGARKKQFEQVLQSYKDGKLPADE